MHINAKTIAALAVLAAGPAIASAADVDTSADKVKAAVTPGEFVLTGSDVKSISDSDSPREYRVCLKKEQGEADMKITYDEHEAKVKLGDCKTVTGRKILATPSSALADKEHIIGSYHRVKTQTASASESSNH